MQSARASRRYTLAEITNHFSGTSFDFSPESRARRPKRQIQHCWLLRILRGLPLKRRNQPPHCRLIDTRAGLQ
jgi:hypothetical protein